jgi:hypothetical protein
MQRILVEVFKMDLFGIWLTVVAIPDYSLGELLMTLTFLVFFNLNGV